MSDDNAGGGILAKLFAAAVMIVGLLVAMILVGIVAIVVFSIQIRGQNEKNQRHIDCIVASASPRPPEYCVGVIDHLRNEGILRPTTIPSTSTTEE